MQHFISRVLLLLITVSFFLTSFSQTQTNTELLKQASVDHAKKDSVLYQLLKTLALQKGWEMVMNRPNGGIAILVGVDSLGNAL